MKDPALFALLRGLLDSPRSAVLAAIQPEGQPCLSLMAFAAAPDLRQLILATEQDTPKYANLRAEPRAAHLIDNPTTFPPTPKRP